MSTAPINNSINNETSLEGMKILEKLGVAMEAKPLRALKLAIVDLSQEILEASQTFRYTDIIQDLENVNMKPMLYPKKDDDVEKVQEKIVEIALRFLNRQHDSGKYDNQVTVAAIPFKPDPVEQKGPKPNKFNNSPFIQNMANAQQPNIVAEKPKPGKLNIKINTNAIIGGLGKTLAVKMGHMKGDFMKQLQASEVFTTLSTDEKTKTIEKSEKIEREVYNKIQAQHKVRLNANEELKPEDSSEFEELMYYYESTLAAYRMQLECAKGYWEAVKTDLKEMHNVVYDEQLAIKLKGMTLPLSPEEAPKILKTYYRAHADNKYLRATIVSLNYRHKAFEDSLVSMKYDKYMGPGWHKKAAEEYQAIRNELWDVNRMAWAISGESGGSLGTSSRGAR